jgi:hypothetical protein
MNRTSPFRRAAAAVALAVIGLIPSAYVAQGRVIGGLGVALTPKGFPKHGPADIQQMFVLGKEVGQYPIFIYPWSQPDMLEVAARVVQLSKDAGMQPIVMLGPTVLTGFRSTYEAPKAVRDKARRGKLTMDDPAVHQAFIAAAIELARLKPPYLGLATEINMMAHEDVQEYIRFAHVYKQVYPLIKKESPQTRVFVSFQWDLFRILDQNEPNKIAEHTKLIDIFRPELDLVAFTSYPATHFSRPSQIPANYYTDLKRHVKASDEIAFTEIGWPSSGKGSEATQQDYIKRLPALMKDIKPRLIIWALLHDVTGVFGADLATTGLLTAQGRRKSGFAAFKALR